MKKIFAMVFVVMILCNTVVIEANAAGVPNDITHLKDDPAADKPDYEVWVNRALNYTVVYARDAAGEFTVPVIAFANSTGKNNGTPTGEYVITKKHRWQPMFGGVYTQYAVRFMPHVMFHSECYTVRNDNSALKWQEYNKLGQQASAGCVRETVADSKWLYDNCKLGTRVIVYDDPNDSMPFDELHMVMIPADSQYRGWDPTDPDPRNPWQEVRPVLHLTSNEDGNTLILPVGASVEDIKAQIGLYTPQGVRYAEEDYVLEIYGNYNLNMPGYYEIYVRGFDLETTLRADETFDIWVAPWK